MLTRYLIWIGLIAALLSGCATKLDWGACVKSAKSSQILNHEAMKNLQPVYGSDGQAAQNTLERYREGFKRPAPRPVYPLSIGVQR